MILQSHRCRWPVSCVAVMILCLPLGVSAEQFTGKVVGIADGDTLSVLREGKAVKVRLHGVDTPEKAQAFGTQARLGESVSDRGLTPPQISDRH